MFRANNKDTRATPLTSYSSVTNVNFEQVNVDWEWLKLKVIGKVSWWLKSLTIFAKHPPYILDRVLNMSLILKFSTSTLNFQ